jgi:hypothetical protein
MKRNINQRNKTMITTRSQRLTPINLATWEGEMGRITDPGQSRKIIHETLFPK